MKETIIKIKDNEIITEVKRNENKTIITVSTDNIQLKVDDAMIKNLDSNKIKSAPAVTDAEDKSIREIKNTISNLNKRISQLEQLSQLDQQRLLESLLF